MAGRSELRVIHRVRQNLLGDNGRMFTFDGLVLSGCRAGRGAEGRLFDVFRNGCPSRESLIAF